ncbi:MAG TPA: FAD-dependent oxidoreductase [Streptosporangiaceae bacterium]|nr:FAD-dependent oxidoreductase [Streptosporangiaceae bacterium]
MTRLRDYTRLVMAAEPKPFWLDRPDAPPARERLRGEAACDLAVIGGGFTGLWTALLAKELYPERSVVLVEGNRVGWAASGRNGGFCDASLTHGATNGRDRFPAEFAALQRLGAENLDAIGAAVDRHGIDCEFERTGTIGVATEEYQVARLREAADGDGTAFLDTDAVRAEVNSPTYLAGVWDTRGTALVQPAALAWGLAAACERLGVRIAERTPAAGLAADADGVRVRLRDGVLRARRVALGTSAFPALLRRLRPYTVPVYDYVLVTEPLSAAQRAAVRWRNRQGIGDSGNQFHYYRLSADDRILWGGYDAIYHFGRGQRAAYDQRPATFARLADHFFTTFPQLEGVGFSHRWGGAIDTCSRFCAFFGTAHRGRVAYALGYTGLGVGASRFGARVMLDLLSGVRTELTELKMVRSKPVPFPPEPLAYLGVQATRWSLARADRRVGRRNLWLRALDAAGMGFDS